MRRRIVKRTTISERRVAVSPAAVSARATGDHRTADNYRVTVVSDGPDGALQIFESGPLGEVAIDEDAEGVLRLIAKKKSR